MTIKIKKLPADLGDGNGGVRKPIPGRIWAKLIERRGEKDPAFAAWVDAERVKSEREISKLLKDY